MVMKVVDARPDTAPSEAPAPQHNPTDPAFRRSTSPGIAGGKQDFRASLMRSASIGATESPRETVITETETNVSNEAAAVAPTATIARREPQVIEQREEVTPPPAPPVEKSSGWFGWVSDAAAGVRDAAKGAVRLGGDAVGWVADKSVEAVGYVADKSVKAAVWVADKGVDAAVYVAEKSIEAGAWVVDKSVAAVSATVDYGVKAVTDPLAVIQDVKDVVVSAKDMVVHGVSVAVDGLVSGAAWLGEKAVNTVKGVGYLLYFGAVGAASAGEAFGSALLGSFQAFLGQKSWDDVSKEFSGRCREIGREFCVNCPGVTQFLGSAWDFTRSAASATWGIVKGVSDTLGISQMLSGVGHLVVAIPHLAYDAGQVLLGRISLSELAANLGSHLDGIGNGLLGGLKCIVEVTGIADLGQTLKHGFLGLGAYGRYEDAEAKEHAKKAAIHGAFAAASAGAIAATVYTGGVAYHSVAAVAAGRATLKEASKQVLKVAAKEFLEQEAKQIGKAAVSEMSTHALSKVAASEGGAALVKGFEAKAVEQLGATATKEAQQAAVERIALNHVLREEAAQSATKTAEKIAAEVQAKGPEILSEEFVKDTAKAVSKERTTELLKELKLTDSIEKLTYDMLEDINKAKPKEAAEKFAQRFGVEQKHAEKMVKEMQTALKSSNSDQAMIKVLEDDITKHITHVFEAEMEQTYKSTFKKGLKGELDAPWSKELKEAVETRSKQLGKDVSKFTDELTEAAWKGAKEGIEEATRLAVREGLERAFKKFRENKNRGALFSGGAAAKVGGLKGGVMDGELVDHKAAGTVDEATAEGRGERVTEFKTSEMDASGEHIQVYERNEVTGKVRKTGDHRIISRNKAA